MVIVEQEVCSGCGVPRGNHEEYSGEPMLRRDCGDHEEPDRCGYWVKPSELIPQMRERFCAELEVLRGEIRELESRLTRLPAYEAECKQAYQELQAVCRAETERRARAESDANEAAKEATFLRDELNTAKSRIESAGKILEAQGCECECDHRWDEHDEGCEPCLACRIDAALRGALVVGPGGIKL